MEFILNSDQEEVCSLAHRYAQEVIAERVEEIEEAEKFPQDLFHAMADMGFLSMSLKEAYGGLELGYVAQSIMIYELSRVSPSTGAVITVSILPLEAIEMYGNEEQKQKYIPAGAAGQIKGSFAFTEPDTGSDPKMLKTIAVRQKDGTYKINGVKRFISNASYEGPMVLFAKEKETQECTAFIINKFCKGYSLSNPWDKVGLQGSNVYDVFLDDVIVTEDDVLGEHGKGFDILIGATAYGKLAFSAVFAGAIAGARDLAVQYAKEKIHRGKPIAKFPTIQEKIARIEANTLSAQLMLYKSADDADRLTDIRAIQCSTALSKGYIADLATETITMALNVLGAYGVTKEYKVERLMRDAMIAPNIEGAADIQRLIAGGYILRH